MDRRHVWVVFFFFYIEYGLELITKFHNHIQKVEAAFRLARLKTEVHKFVKCCQVCIQAEPDRSSYPGKL
jgi:hypothetical protein